VDFFLRMDGAVAQRDIGDILNVAVVGAGRM